MLKLFYARGTISLASHIALEEAGADHEVVRVDFASAQQKTPDYLAVNPKGRVPALVTDRGILTETPAVLTYIAQIYPDAGLAPADDPFAYAQLQSFCAYLCSTVHVSHAHMWRGVRWADDEASQAAMKARAPKNMADGIALVETEMFAGPWVMGEQYTIADPYLFTIATWLERDEVDPARFPNVLDHRNRMHERAAVKRALAIQNA